MLLVFVSPPAALHTVMISNKNIFFRVKHKNIFPNKIVQFFGKCKDCRSENTIGFMIKNQNKANYQATNAF